MSISLLDVNIEKLTVKELTEFMVNLKEKYPMLHKMIYKNPTKGETSHGVKQATTEESSKAKGKTRKTELDLIHLNKKRHY